MFESVATLQTCGRLKSAVWCMAARLDLRELMHFWKACFDTKRPAASGMIAAR
jgi:hypothetical protein